MAGTSTAFEKLRASVVPRRIVVIGSADSFVNSLRCILERFGHWVTTATDGQSGVDIVKAEQPDVVISSIELARLNGFEVAEAIREALPQKPLLVAHSSYSKSEISQQAKQAGFDRYLGKPASVVDMLRVIASVDGTGDDVFQFQ
jgi:CheY-like chemotaxis protein